MRPVTLKTTALLAIAAAIGASAVSTAPSGAAPPSPFASMVDEYLDQFARRHPSIAAGNGIHAHDDLLEDFSEPAIASEIEGFKGWRARLERLDAAPLSPDERVDRRILLGIVDGWLLDLDQVRTWTRNPMIYAAAISDGVHNLMTMDSSPAPDRMKQAAAKLEGVPRLLASARANIRNPPRVFVERAVTMFGGVSDLLGHDLALAFAQESAPVARCARPGGRRRAARGRRVPAGPRARTAAGDRIVRDWDCRRRGEIPG